MFTIFKNSVYVNGTFQKSHCPQHQMLTRSFKTIRKMSSMLVTTSFEVMEIFKVSWDVQLCLQRQRDALNHFVDTSGKQKIYLK